jgi:hypothetical protein
MLLHVKALLSKKKKKKKKKMNIFIKMMKNKMFLYK